MEKRFASIINRPLSLMGSMIVDNDMNLEVLSL